MHHMYSFTPQEESGFCKICSRPLPKNDRSEVCIFCRKMLLFADVREYIRENDVREEDVAEHFNIPVEMVRDWIKEGRITYKEDGRYHIYADRMCEICGRPIEIGSVCLSCRRKAKQEAERAQKARGSISGTYIQPMKEEIEMRFLNGKK